MTTPARTPRPRTPTRTASAPAADQLAEKLPVVKARTQRTLKGPSHPGQLPIAVVNKDGHILPFTDNHVDRMHLIAMDVSYIYDRGDLAKIVEQNEKALADGAEHNIRYGAHLPPAPEVPEGINVKEFEKGIATQFSAEMIED